MALALKRLTKPAATAPAAPPDWQKTFWRWLERLIGLRRELVAPSSAGFVEKERATPAASGFSAIGRKAPDPGDLVAVSQAQQLGPRGWLGALFAHGAASLMFEMEYLKIHRHLLPSVAAAWNDKKYKVELDYSRGTLLARRFEEWQCPAFDSQSPRFDKFSEGVQAGTWRDAINKVVYGQGAENHWLNTLLRRDVRAEGLPEFSPGDRPAKAVSDWLEWTMSRDHQGEGRALDLGVSGLKDYLNAEVRPVGLWNRSAADRREWGDRLMRWYYVAQFAVWSCEMLRLHRKSAEERAPDWWRVVCARWGIGVRNVKPPFEQWDGWNYTNAWVVCSTDAKPLNEVAVQLSKNLRVKDMDDSAWEAIARRVQGLALFPGHPATLGGQIAQPGAPRNVFDIPVQLGSAVPPYWIGGGNWNEFAAGYWLNKNEDDIKSYWTDVFLPAWNSLFGLLSAGCASSTFNATVTSLQGVYTASVQIMRAAAGIANGVPPDAGELIARIAVICGEIGALSGADVEIPSDLWNQLKGLEEVAGFAGDLSEWAETQAEYVRTTLDVVQNEDGYRFLDDLLGGLVN